MTVEFGFTYIRLLNVISTSEIFVLFRSEILNQSFFSLNAHNRSSSLTCSPIFGINLNILS